MNTRAKRLLPGLLIAATLAESQNKGTVRLVLNGAEIQNNDGAPIYVKKADKTVITLQDGTQNTVSDGKNYAKVAGEEDQPDAAIYSKTPGNNRMPGGGGPRPQR